MEFLGSMAGLLVIGLFVVTFNFQAFEIPSGSMEETMLVGDHLFVDRITAAPPTGWLRPVVPYDEVKRNDIIVFLSPVQPGLHVVKRVIGLPGDRIHLRNGVLFRNGELVEEPYVTRKDVHHDPYRDEFPALSPENAFNVHPRWAAEMPRHVKDGEIIVPPGHYFGMGDNRDRSLDSRFWGFIPQEHLIGRPTFIYWSFITPDHQAMKTAMRERIAWLFHVAVNFLGDTRWRRTFQLVR